MRAMFVMGLVGMVGATAAGQVTLNVWMTADNAF